MRSDRLTGGRVGGFDAGDLRGDFDPFADLAGLEGNCDSRRFRYPHFDLIGAGLRKSRFVHDDVVGAGGQEGYGESAVRTGINFSRQRICAAVGNLHFGVGDAGAAAIHNFAADRSGRAALGERASRHEAGQQKHHERKPEHTSHRNPLRVGLRRRRK